MTEASKPDRGQLEVSAVSSPLPPLRELPDEVTELTGQDSTHWKTRVSSRRATSTALPGGLPGLSVMSHSLLRQRPFRPEVLRHEVQKKIRGTASRAMTGARRQPSGFRAPEARAWGPRQDPLGAARRPEHSRSGEEGRPGSKGFRR